MIRARRRCVNRPRARAFPSFGQIAQNLHREPWTVQMASMCMGLVRVNEGYGLHAVRRRRVCVGAVANLYGDWNNIPVSLTCVQHGA